MSTTERPLCLRCGETHSERVDCGKALPVSEWEARAKQAEHSVKVLTEHVEALRAWLDTTETLWDKYAQAALTGALADTNLELTTAISCAVQVADAMMLRRKEVGK